MNDRHLITHPEFKSDKIIHGFIGKNFKLVHKHQYIGLGDYVQENRNIIKQKLKLRNISMLKQVHGDTCIDVSNFSDEQFIPAREKQADAHVTSKAGIALCVQTADCIPILFADSNNSIIGAAHSGWKGVLSGIIDSTILEMQKLGANVQNIEVIIGPCIHQKSYEVGREFFDKFIMETNYNKRFFNDSNRANHYLFDLLGYAKSKLRKYELKNIFDINMDTLEDEANFFSYRRSTLRGEKLDGHILSFISLYT